MVRVVAPACDGGVAEDKGKKCEEGRAPQQTLQPPGQLPPLDAAQFPLAQTHWPRVQHCEAATPLVAQQVFGGQQLTLPPPPQFVKPAPSCPEVHSAALTGSTPNAVATAAASAPPMYRNAFRRGIGVARMRAMLSKSRSMISPAASVTSDALPCIVAGAFCGLNIKLSSVDCETVVRRCTTFVSHHRWRLRSPMPYCPACDAPLKRTHRTALERVLYAEVLFCSKCDLRVRRFHPSVRTPTEFLFSRHTSCIRCGTLNVRRSHGHDRIDPVSNHLLSWIQRVLGAPRNKCSACRLQYYDWRRPVDSKARPH